MEEKEMEKIRKFFKDESGANMVEYALLTALIGVVLIGTITFLQGGIDATFQKAGTELNTAASGS
jgi:Flp pilus assembly pilin Flp